MGLRWIPDIDVDRAKLRSTLSYAITPELAVGVEWNPLGDDVRPIATWRALDETDVRPALIFSTSSDRIGTTNGSAFSAVFAKDVEAWTNLPVSPYFGVSYGTAEDELRAIGGLLIRYDEAWSSTHLWDGHNLHHIVEYAFESGHNLGLVVADLDGRYSLGVSWSWNFGTGGSDSGAE